MTNRLVKYSLAGSLVLLLAVPAVSYSQMGPRGPRRFDDGRGIAANQGPRQSAGRGRMAGRGSWGRDSVRGGNRFAAGNRLGVRIGFGARGLAGRGSGLAGRALNHAEDIALTAEQRSQIEEVQRVRQEASIQRRADGQIAQLELRDLMDAETRDIAAIEAKLRQISDQQIAERMEGLGLDRSVSEILTAEQVEQLEELGPRANRGRGSRQGGRREPRRGPRLFTPEERPNM